MEPKTGFIAALLVSLGLLGATHLATTTYERVKAKDQANFISVTGSAERVIISDAAKWTVNFSRSSDLLTLKDMNVQIKNDLTNIMRTLQANGIKDTEVTIQPLSVSPICEGQYQNPYYDRSGGPSCGTNKVAGYNLQQTLLVQSSNVAVVTKASQLLPGQFVQDGILFTSLGLEYYYQKLADLKLEMLAAAAKDAGERAKSIANTAGNKIGAAQNVSAGVFQITAPNTVEVNDYGTYDTTSIDKKVTSVVRMTFRLE